MHHVLTFTCLSVQKKHDSLRQYIAPKQLKELEPQIITEGTAGQAIVLAHILSKQFSRSDVLAQIAKEREAAVHKASRASRRRSSAYNTAISDFTDPEDCVTYLVYPTAVDSLVSVAAAVLVD